MNKFKRQFFYNMICDRQIKERIVIDIAKIDKDAPIKNIINRNDIIYNQDKSREYEKECIKSAWGNMKGYYIAASGIEFIYKDIKSKGDKDE